MKSCYSNPSRVATLSAIAATILSIISLGSARVPAAMQRRRINSLGAINNVSRYHFGGLHHQDRNPSSDLSLEIICIEQDDETSYDTRDKIDVRATLSRGVLPIRGGGSGRSILSNFSEFIAASKSRSWTVLLLSIVTDALSTTLMKTAQVESSTPKLVMAFCGYFVSLSGLAVAVKSIDVSIAYAVWSAVGTALVSATGIVLFGERYDFAKIICLSMIVLGVLGLNLTADH